MSIRLDSFQASKKSKLLALLADAVAWISYIGFFLSCIWGMSGPSKVPPGTPLSLPEKLVLLDLGPAMISLAWLAIRGGKRYIAERTSLIKLGQGQQPRAYLFLLPFWVLLGSAIIIFVISSTKV